jgi:hypothetical protein
MVRHRNGTLLTTHTRSSMPAVSRGVRASLPAASSAMAAVAGTDC